MLQTIIKTTTTIKLTLLIFSVFLFFHTTNAQWTIKHLDEYSYNTGTVKFKNDSMGLFMGGGSTVLKTMDIGETWDKKQINIDVNVYDFQFIGDSAVFAIGDSYTSNRENVTSKLIKSEDLGESWELIASFSNKNLYSIHFFNEDSGVVAGWDRIYRTIDSGISWDTVWNPQQIDFKWGGIKQMDFPSNHIGYAVGRGRNNSSTSPFLEGFILKTWNAGQSWDTIKKVPGELLSIDFLNNDTGYVGRGSIFKTTDGGESWAEAAIINSPADYYAVNSIHFISQTTGFAVGAPTAFVPEGYTYFIISKTTDGGESWASYRSIGLPLNSVHFLNDSTGFAAGWYNLLMKSNGILDELPENYPMHLADLDGVNVNENALSEFEIQIYPNPTSETLYIKNLNVNNEIKKTVLINTSGQIVKIHKPQNANNQLTKLDLSDLIPGIYMIKLELSGANEIMKIIKK